VQALLGNPLTIYGDGTQTRSFCYVEDLVEGLIKLMEQEQTVGPVNLGNPDEFTIRELAEMVCELHDGPTQINYKTLPQDDPKRRKPDISLAAEALRWKPRIPLHHGLKATYEYFKKRLADG